MKSDMEHKEIYMITQWSFDKEKLRKDFYSENEEKERLSLMNIIKMK